MGEPKGITVTEPISSSCFDKIGSALIYGKMSKFLLQRYSVAVSVPKLSGRRYFGSFQY